MKRVLIANRGEIAVRIIRTLRKMKIETVAVYSDTDKGAMFVKSADYAVALDGVSSEETYLNQDKIVAICKEFNVDGVHPGYGFLSENAVFANRLVKEGIKLIGPSAEAMELMGDKISAKKTVAKFDVPMIPGVDYAVSSPDEALTIAKDIGYPVLIKAAAGGGGKGMRVVWKEDEMQESFERATSEASKAFGNADCFVEKYIVNPKHIEVQIMADAHGNIVHLFERDCSIQRRHQKVIEEAPSATLSEEKREAIGSAAVDVAKSCNYEGAGTVEFIYDESGDFYFLEMNTRLQVEHPVTEMVTGLDLVEWQVRVARGEKLPENLRPKQPIGHSLEVRIYAEDSFDNFTPSIGKLTAYVEPQNARVDSGVELNDEISIYFDPMISKLVVHADTREEAIESMRIALNNYRIEGVSTTKEFALFAIDHKSFRNGSFSTSFVGDFYTPETLQAYIKEKDQVKALIANALWNHDDVKFKRTL